jgi:hypothetical protein
MLLIIFVNSTLRYLVSLKWLNRGGCCGGGGGVYHVYIKQILYWYNINKWIASRPILWYSWPTLPRGAGCKIAGLLQLAVIESSL